MNGSESPYSGEHQTIRKHWKPLVDAGQVFCRELVCVNPGGRWIRPGTPWHLAHEPDGRTYRGPAHAICNLSEVNRRRDRAGRTGKPKPTVVKRQPAKRWRPTTNW
jgi:hypothetical protein